MSITDPSTVGKKAGRMRTPASRRRVAAAKAASSVEKSAPRMGARIPALTRNALHVRAASRGVGSPNPPVPARADR